MTVNAPTLPRVLIRDLRQHVGRTVRVCGWVRAIRDQKRVQFLILRDHTGLAQVTVERSVEHAALNAAISGLTRESAVAVVGVVEENPIVKLGGVEIRLRDLTVHGLADRILPLDPSGAEEPNPDVRLNWRFLDLRRPENLLIFQVQTVVEHAMREYWIREGFLEIHSPKLMGSASESGAELFELSYFGRPAYLAQSPQFYKQMAMAAGFDRVFEIGPAFRADPSFTPRHATEFTSVDVEMSWIDSHEDVMAFEERWLQYVLQVTRDRLGEAIHRTFGVEVVVPSVPFPRIPLEEALRIVARRGHTPQRPDLDPAGERLLGEYAVRELGHPFVFVTDYPAEVRPFYHMRHPDRPSLTRSFDLLWNGVEVTTGAQREHRYEILVAQAREKGLSLEPLQFYLDFFRYGCPPHGGFGFGLARMLMILLGQPSIREVTFIYRGPTRLYP
ncbi:MAG: aspartate--tRNA(Asn) ligase [Armatimonadota bacterium]|nr:aspartate--tRNA(Asn) ligase [Armatimonadota bacterium]MDR7400782.1 aspartate--tRNA(Asn) ligase [Armatimonadota bacterium]MDR7403881.1 aspartate--tRNA(Asn) ligase [Armatimonadota bacterium]MDR7436624.1 aspartate--tRNA(Asn) ligase [Armatimonadota bacterium]MDR7472957.1 aspartate--tRNA(Asn) ligase [Armatimonadota bacterium]